MEDRPTRRPGESFPHSGTPRPASGALNAGGWVASARSPVRECDPGTASRGLSLGWAAALLLGLGGGAVLGLSSAAGLGLALLAVGADVDVAGEDGAFVDDELCGAEVALVACALLELDSVVCGEVTLDFALDDDRAGFDVGGHLGFLGDVQAAGGVDLAFDPGAHLVPTCLADWKPLEFVYARLEEKQVRRADMHQC